MKKWTREKILEAIRGRNRQGRSLGVGIVCREASGLRKAARREYGSWVTPAVPQCSANRHFRGKLSQPLSGRPPGQVARPAHSRPSAPAAAGPACNEALEGSSTA